jgi:Omp85 superfamily domain
MVAALAAASTATVAAQAPPPVPPPEATAGADEQAPATKVAPPQPSTASTRQEAIEKEQAAKVPTLKPYEANGAERYFEKLDILLQGGGLAWHPFFESAYSGGGFTLGAGRSFFVSPYNTLDFRGSYTVQNYKRIEAEFRAPRMFNRRAELVAIGGWREATKVGFYGIGPDTSTDDQTNYLFQQPYGSALFTIFPNRRLLMLRGGAEFSQWKQEPGEGTNPSVEEVYTPETLPGLGAKIKYLHTQGAIGLDGRTSPGYSRRGAYLAATLHDYKDQDDNFGFQIAEYEGIAHLPILRETWVLSFRARMQHANEKDAQQIPFFMLPALGGGSTLRGYSSWRFRDQNSLLLQAEWRIMVNRYLDLAFFYDAGKVAARTKDLDLDHLKDDFGVGLRFH